MTKFNSVTIPEMGQGHPAVIKLICDDPWFTYIRNGLKPVEGRKNTPKHQKIQVGCLIDFSNGKESFLASVVEIRSYPTLEAYLNDVTFQKALPGISSFEEAMKVYHQWSTPEEIQKHGFLGIFVKPITQ
jgi:ASC-1-like (ASCH) protein